MSEHALKNKVVIVGGVEKNLGGMISRDMAIGGAKAVAANERQDVSQKWGR